MTITKKQQTQRMKQWFLARTGMGRGDTEVEGWEAQSVMHRMNYKDASYSTGTHPVFYKNYEWNTTFKTGTHCTVHLQLT